MSRCYLVSPQFGSIKLVASTFSPTADLEATSVIFAAIATRSTDLEVGHANHEATRCKPSHTCS